MPEVTPGDVRSQLQSLSIPGDRRPAATSRARGSFFRVFVVAAVLVGLGIAAYAGRDRWLDKIPGISTPSTAAPLVETMTVMVMEPPPPAPVLTATGKIVSDHRVEVSTKVSGQITALYFEQGHRVEHGQLLARIEDVLYRARRDEIAGRLAQARANLAYQQENFRRVESLVKEASAQPIEYADAKRWLDDAEARVKAEQAALDFAQKALDDCEVIAPISGVILTRNVEVGDFVAAEGGRGANANAQFAVIADMTKLRVEVDISELDIARIRSDMPCEVIPDAYKDRKYKGHVLWLDPGANYSKATVQVKVRIENPDDYLRVEGSAQVLFRSMESTSTDSGVRGIWIPLTGCQTEADGNSLFVYKAVDFRWRPTRVVVGRRSGTHMEIVDGLAAGDVIAIGGLESLTPGAPVHR